MYYVTMTDKFLSGWGKAKGRVAKYVIECETYAEAEVVAENAKHRTEMKYVKVASKKPKYNLADYQATFATKEEAGNWFIPNYFKKEK